MKKILTIAVTLGLLICFTACEKKQEPQPQGIPNPQVNVEQLREKFNEDYKDKGEHIKEWKLSNRTCIAEFGKGDKKVMLQVENKEDESCIEWIILSGKDKEAIKEYFVYFNKIMLPISESNDDTYYTALYSKLDYGKMSHYKGLDQNERFYHYQGMKEENLYIIGVRLGD